MLCTLRSENGRGAEVRELPCLKRVPKQKAFRTIPGRLWKIGTLPISRQVGSFDNRRVLGESCDLQIKSRVRNEVERSL
jgi:hypothetical protein